jgi:hypothetical protein
MKYRTNKRSLAILSEEVTHRIATPVCHSVPISTEIEDVLLRHAHHASSLATLCSHIEAQWLQFANVAEAKYLPLALSVTKEIDNLRRELVNEMIHIAELVRDVERPKIHVSVRDSAFVVAPDSRR